MATGTRNMTHNPNWITLRKEEIDRAANNTTMRSSEKQPLCYFPGIF